MPLHSGLPHSEIFGSKTVCVSPKLIAACHVLLRLWKPRHPPCALSNFLSRYSITRFFFTLILYLQSTCQRTACYFRNNQLLMGNRTLILHNFMQNASFRPIKNIPFGIRTYFFSFSAWLFKPCQGLWRISESNRWPPACKAGALASWANPPYLNLVGLRGLEPRTFTLSV